MCQRSFENDWMGILGQNLSFWMGILDQNLSFWMGILDQNLSFWMGILDQNLYFWMGILDQNLSFWTIKDKKSWNINSRRHFYCYMYETELLFTIKLFHNISSWNTAKVGIKHQSINLLVLLSFIWSCLL